MDNVVTKVMQVNFYTLTQREFDDLLNAYVQIRYLYSINASADEVMKQYHHCIDMLQAMGIEDEIDAERVFFIVQRYDKLFNKKGITWDACDSIKWALERYTNVKVFSL